ncbi:FAD-dependent oxidoreductase [Streptomyces yunnanensis]|uniref:2-polyprenyl-6-methoxyphenol hydroxylase n=1 Tax=Streptomyces yunnanensis TaxID=156453 RepID=A0A9X8MKQ1_9ACTN|nr:FAD-dependent oxidoreductase [Streptomyces yunnanensis]SHK94997.1 2-polyprenyl-6-methoxyphenol hydroxylase [Streptomyces yunnanensis]
MNALNRKPGVTRSDTDGGARPDRDADVIVVGAGPTGLLLAGDLAEAGLAVTLLERRDGTTSNLSRALAVHARSLEQLDARGLADELIAGGHRLPGFQVFGKAMLPASRLPTRFPFVLITPQYEVERLLLRRARQAGVTFRHGAEVLGLDQDADGVTVHFRTTGEAVEEPAEGVGSLRTGYVVGTDGARSAVREAVGLPFPGKAVIRSVVLADVRLASPPDSPFMINAAPDAFALIGSFGDGWYRVIGWNRRAQADDDAPADLDEVREVTRLAFGTDYGMQDARWISRFRSDERQAPAYRVGRVFLAGDAAHIHSPAGGQGMNVGLQDAANLSWKLAAVVKGHSPDHLLDSYQDERHPVGTAVLRSSGAIIRLALVHSTPGRALRALGVQLLTHLRPLSQRAMGRVSGIDVAYPAERGAHRLAGRRAPDVRLADGGRLYALLRQGKFVLITPEGEPPEGMPAAPAPDRVVTATWESGRRTALLVRPDGYVAWATDATAPAERAAALRTALAHWTGSESESGSTSVVPAPAAARPLRPSEEI